MREALFFMPKNLHNINGSLTWVSCRVLNSLLWNTKEEDQTLEALAEKFKSELKEFGQIYSFSDLYRIRGVGKSWIKNFVETYDLKEAWIKFEAKLPVYKRIYFIPASDFQI